MSSETIALVAGVLLSLGLSYIPGLNAKWEQLAPDNKQGIMGLLLFVATVGIYVAGCQGWVTNLACPTAWQAVEQFILAAMANQATYGLTKRK